MEDQGAQGGAEYSKQHSSLSPQHVELIVKSGISPVIARLHGYRTETISSASDTGFSASQLLVPALVIPLFNARGEIINHQIRPDQPRLGDSRKPRKYETPTRSRVVIDVHPALSRSRRSSRRHLSIRLICRRRSTMLGCRSSSRRGRERRTAPCRAVCVRWR